MPKSETYGYPAAIYLTDRINGEISERVYFFDMVAPITGDGIYRREDETGAVYHALITCPHARQNQLRAFRT